MTKEPSNFPEFNEKVRHVDPRNRKPQNFPQDQKHDPKRALEEKRRKILEQTIEIAKKSIHHIEKISSEGDHLRAVFQAYIHAAQSNFSHAETLRAWQLLQEYFSRMLDREDLLVVRRQEILDLLMRVIVSEMMEI